MIKSRRLAVWGVVTCFGVALSLAIWLRAEGAPDVLDQLQPGEWYEVPNSKLHTGFFLC